MNSWPKYWEDPIYSDEFWLARARVFCSNFEKQFDLRKDQRLLDFGGGCGFITKILSPKCLEAVLLESSLKSIDRARIVNESNENVRYIHLHQKDDLATKLQGYKFDYVIMNSVAQYLPLDLFILYLENLKGSLRENGRILITDLVIKDSNLLKDLKDIAVFYFEQGNLKGFLEFFFTEIIKLKDRLSLPMFKHSSEDIARRLKGSYKISWIKNLTLNINRHAMLLTPC